MAGKPKKRHPVVQPADPSYRFIPLTQGQNAIVDTDDFEWLSRHCWHVKHHPITGKYYAVRGAPDDSKYRQKTVLMHREILGCVIGEEGDHRNGNSLDNRRGNLRKATDAQNTYNARKGKANTSGFKGVFRVGRKWIARIGFKHKRINLGTFASPIEAAIAYDEMASDFYGEFAHLNFPLSEDGAEAPSQSPGPGIAPFRAGL